MGQVHERVHQFQTGEPLLNEVVQAAIWSRFLTEESLWAYQRDTRRELVREMTVVNEFPELFDAALASGLDTAAMMADLGVGTAYFACCLLANRFDAGLLRYDQYLQQLLGLLRVRGNRRAVRDITIALF